MMKVRRNYTQDILISAQHLPAGDEGCGHKVVRGVVSSRHIIGVKNSLMCQTCLTLTLWASATTRWEEWQFSKSTLTLWASAATREESGSLISPHVPVVMEPLQDSCYNFPVLHSSYMNPCRTSTDLCLWLSGADLVLLLFTFLYSLPTNCFSISSFLSSFWKIKMKVEPCSRWCLNSVKVTTEVCLRCMSPSF